MPNFLWSCILFIFQGGAPGAPPIQSSNSWSPSKVGLKEQVGVHQSQALYYELRESKPRKRLVLWSLILGLRQVLQEMSDRRFPLSFQLGVGGSGWWTLWIIDFSA